MPQQKISFPDEIWKIVKTCSAATGLTEAEIVRMIFMLGLPHFTPTIAAIQNANPASPERSFIAIITKLLAGIEVSEAELSIAGYEAGISIEDMYRLRDCLGKNGGKNAAVLHG